MPSAVVSLLDPAHTVKVERIWEDLRQHLGLTGVLVTPWPHFSFQVASSYTDRAELEARLHQFAERTAPFAVRTVGLASFPEPFPVVYVAVAKGAALGALHASLWSKVSPLAHGGVPYYQPDRWTPHITLAHGNTRPQTPLSSSELTAVVRHLADQDFSWQVSIDNVALIWDEDGVEELARRFPLRGRSDAGTRPVDGDLGGPRRLAPS
jgi:2'-5' RNA ligase